MSLQRRYVIILNFDLYINYIHPVSVLSRLLLHYDYKVSHHYYHLDRCNYYPHVHHANGDDEPDWKEVLRLDTMKTSETQKKEIQAENRKKPPILTAKLLHNGRIFNRGFKVRTSPITFRERWFSPYNNAIIEMVLLPNKIFKWGRIHIKVYTIPLTPCYYQSIYINIVIIITYHNKCC
jgi:hypothetical protein